MKNLIPQSLTRLKSQMALWLIPALLLLLGSAMALKMYPLYSGHDHYNSDPGYAYLFNGLLLLDRHSPYHIDHPGTPLQALIAVLVYLQWCYMKLIGAVNPDVVVAVMSDPERFLLFISRVLLALNVVAVFFIGKKVLSLTKSTYLAIFCQCSLLTYGIFGTKLLFPAPEALLAFLSLALLTTLLPLMFKGDLASKDETKIAIFAGAIFGIGMAVKFNFLPMAGLLLLLNGTRNRLIALAVALGAWVIGVLPIIKKLSLLWTWIYNLVTHTGKYGIGDKGIFDTAAILPRLKSLIEGYPFFYFALILFASYLAYAAARYIVCTSKESPEKKATQSHTFKVILILLGVCLIQTVIVLKHFGQHYMIPVLPIAFIGISVLIQALLKNQSSLGLVIKTFFVITTIALITYSSSSLFGALRPQRIDRNLSVKQIQSELAKYHNPLVLTTYGCYLPQCALMFGIEYAPGLDKKIPPFLTNYYGFNVWNSMLIIDGHGFYALSFLEPFIEQKRPIFLITYIDFPVLDVFEKELVLTAGDQKLYRVTGLTRAK